METSRRTRELVALLVLAVLALVAGVFFARFTAAAVLLQRLAPPAAAAVLTALASVGCGALAFRIGRILLVRVGAVEGTGESEPTDELLAGAAIFGTIVAGLAAAGWLSASALRIVLFVAAAGGITARGREITQALTSIRAGRMLILLPPIAVAAVAAMAPVNTPDELVYKLSVPKTWLLFGGMVELPLNSNSYFPMSVYMADLAAMTWGAGGARLFHLLLYLATLRVTHRLSVRISGSPSLWPTAVVAWTPALAIIAGWAWAEWAMLGLVLLSFLRFREYLSSGLAGDLAVSAVSLGAAISAKYTALPWLAVFSLVALWRMRGTRASRRLLAVSALIVAVTGGFFYLRNAIWTGSPFAPFFLPGSPRIENFRSDAGGLHEVVRGYDVFHEGIIDDSLGVLMPAAVLLSPLALLARSAIAADLFAVGAVQLLFLLPLAPTSRLIVLGAVPLALLGTDAAWRAALGAGRAARAALATLGAAALAGQMLLVAWVFVTSWQFLPYLVGAESETAYLGRTRDFHRVFAWIERNTAPNSKLLLLGENRPFHLDRRAIAQGNLDGPRMAAWLESFPTAEALAGELRREGFTHVLVHKPWYRVARPGAAPLRMMEKEFVLLVPPGTDAVLREVLSTRARPVYGDASHVLFELRR